LLKNSKANSAGKGNITEDTKGSLGSPFLFDKTRQM